MKKESHGRISIKKIVLLTISVIFVVASILVVYFRNNFFDFSSQPTSSQPLIIDRKKECWINIFVHGSFGSLLGFLSVSNVIKDDIKGTSYKKLTKKMRNDPYFYRTQPMLQKGLVRLEPTFSLDAGGESKSAAFPIIKAYQLIYESIESETQDNHFYTFGWSGLLSQNRRRKEAIRFFNEIKEELVKYHKQGIHPKIRMISHSHGGNLILNLAAINKILKMKPLIQGATDELSNDSNENESLLEMLKIMQALPFKPSEKIKNKYSQKRWDYFPLKEPLIVDEFISYGTPIQPETESFCFDDTFKKIYLFYSEEDVVQAFDWVSTKQYHSSQRLTDPSKGKHQNRVIQAKIMVARKIPENNLQKEDFGSEKREESKNSSLFQRIFSSNKIFSKSDDPTHRELWFVNWMQNNTTKINLFGVMPSVVFTPFFTKILDDLELDDIDLNIDLVGDSFIIVAFKHDEMLIQKQQGFPFKLIEEIKSKFAVWQPTIEEKDKEFSIISGYSN